MNKLRTFGRNESAITHLFDSDGLLVFNEEDYIAVGLLLFNLVKTELHFLANGNTRRLK